MTNHETSHISDSLAEKVYWDNVRDNQIGGETDGISREDAEDLGFYPPRSTEDPLIEIDPVESDNVIGIENVPETPVERKRAKSSNTHPARRHLREMPRQGANNELPAEFNPDQEHSDAAVIGIAAAREALRQRRGDQ